MEDKVVITRIEKQKKNKKRYNVYLNGEYGLSVHEDILLSERLLTGKEIDKDYLAKLSFVEEKNKVWQKALRYLGYKARTTIEVRNHLLKYGYDLENIDSIINRLLEEKLLDDNLYAKQYVKQRALLNPRGKKLLAYELKRKGLNDTAISESLEDYDEDSEYEFAVKLIENKHSLFINKDKAKSLRKVTGYLERRGFSYSTINKVLNKFEDNFF